MDTHSSARLLSIGEFAAATQLSPKALRLYDEQRLLRPATVDATNGYRYYSNEQIALGRLIRTLRDMDLPLAQVAEIVAAPGARTENLLRQFALECERRFAQQKRAFQTALALLRQGSPTDLVPITERARPAVTVAVRPFLGERRFLLERFRSETAAGYATLAQAGVTPAGEPLCVLVDPLSDEEGRLEAVIPVAAPVAIPRGVTVRQLPAVTCAALAVEFTDTGALDFTAALDALFDWFDQRGHRAIEPPAVSFVAGAAGVRTEITWAYETAASVPIAR